MNLTSSAFQTGQPIPGKYCCTGQDISPPLNWSGTPANTQSFTLILYDPDAPNGDFTHWVVYNLPRALNSLEESFQVGQHPDWHAASGRNSFGQTGYGGPCPPVGETHRYFFHLYALDSRLEIGSGADRDQVIDAMHGHILDDTQLWGTFQRVRTGITEG